MKDNIFLSARRIVERESQWSAGQARTVHDAAVARVIVQEGGADGGCLLYLTLVTRDNLRESAACGILSPRKGWTWTMTQGQYDTWVEQASKLL